VIRAGYSSEADRALSPRMRQALEGASRGETAKQTARRLGVTEPTVRTVLAAARDRLGVGSTAAAVAIAVRHGLL